MDSEEGKTLPAKDEGVGEDRIVKETKLTLPQGMVMAYKMKPLVFKEKGWDILHIADEKQKCFPELGWEMQPLPRRAQGFCRLDFRHLQAEVSHYVKKAQLLEKVGNVVFSSILAMLGDREALHDLEDKLEQKPLGHLDGPGGAILNALRESSYDKSANSEDSISYLLGVINMLSDLQHDVLAWSVKKKILLQQRDLVRSPQGPVSPKEGEGPERE
ncbi:gasdermin-C-like [Pteropus vampyrus]|uniref:Gasdermin-C-like n=1 Tax=Pteropus vampyrus TaxID=132908 RepID=A0A6P6CH19_PTEVA|nr:gasdermin-C-like [Pteropus vampyrus]